MMRSVSWAQPSKVLSPTVQALVHILKRSDQELNHRQAPRLAWAAMGIVRTAIPFRHVRSWLATTIAVAVAPIVLAEVDTDGLVGSTRV